jgi:LPXTG-motif cell wall-anchored protein
LLIALLVALAFGALFRRRKKDAGGQSNH